jgi:hypothetical protein
MRLLTLEVSTTRKKRQGRWPARWPELETKKPGKMVWRTCCPWRILHRDDVQDEEDGEMVRSPRSGVLAGGHGDGGERRRAQQNPLSSQGRNIARY